MTLKSPLTGLLMAGLLMAALPPPVWPGGRAEDKIVFAIGTVDQSSVEFYNGRFADSRIVTIEAKGAVDPDLMPRRLIHPDGPYSPDRSDAAQEVVIRFRLRRDAMRPVFRLARGGDSDNLVTVDGATVYRVTPAMLGSDEGPVFGSYDLDLGPLPKGVHTLRLSMPADGLGFNGSFQWDALILYRE